MGDQYVSFSNANSVDVFPSFKSFQQPKDEQGAFTVDKQDIEEMKNKPIPTNPIQKSKKPKRHNVISNSNEKANPVIAQCDICSVPISGPIVYDSHSKGKKHQTQLAATLAKNPEYKAPTYEELCAKKQEPVPVDNQNENAQALANDNNTAPPSIPPKKLNCNLCNVSCNSQQMFDNHVAGRKHQMKAKANNLTNSVAPRTVPDNNPSSSNYCDVCSIQLNSEDELTDHLSQKKHQTKAKEAESCAKDAAEMNINFDDYKMSTTNVDKDKFEYQCTTCVKKFKFKTQLIDHLKSPHHAQLSNRINNNQRPSRKPSRGTHQATRGGVVRGGVVRGGGGATRGHSFSSFRGSNKPSGKSRPNRSQGSLWNQSSQSYGEYFNEQTPYNPFGAFDPTNQATYQSSNDNNYYSTSSNKRSSSYEQIPSGYDGFFPKRSRTYDNQGDNSQDYSSNDNSYYSPAPISNYPSNNDNYSSQANDYSNQSSMPQPPWQYQPEPNYDQQQYSHSESNYTSQMYYPPDQPPLPDYAPPPLPNYPPPSPQSRYSQNPSYLGDTTNQGNNTYYQSSFHH